jgi:Xaa-Pro dipeptidase
MINGIGDSTADKELSLLVSSRHHAVPIGLDEHSERLRKVRQLMEVAGVDALYLDATASLRYFTGMQCSASERLHGAIVATGGELVYVCPDE